MREGVGADVVALLLPTLAPTLVRRAKMLLLSPLCRYVLQLISERRERVFTSAFARFKLTGTRYKYRSIFFISHHFDDRSRRPSVANHSILV